MRWWSDCTVRQGSRLRFVLNLFLIFPPKLRFEFLQNCSYKKKCSKQANRPLSHSFRNGGSRFDREANDDVAFFRKQVSQDFNTITKPAVVFRIER